jgi:hypothetical protein
MQSKVAHSSMWLYSMAHSSNECMIRFDEVAAAFHLLLHSSKKPLNMLHSARCQPEQTEVFLVKELWLFKV